MPEEIVNLARNTAVAHLAARQHGVISVLQLKSIGLSSSAIGDRVSTGRLHRIHRGVYAVGHAGLSNEGRWMAAVLACGEGAVLSHQSAAELWGMLRTRQSSAAGVRRHPRPIDVTTRGGGRAPRKGIRIHRSRTLETSQCTRRDGVPVTNPARTLADLRRIFPSQVFAAALREAEFLGLPIGDQWHVDHTRSELEARFLALVRRHRLPQPEVNVRVGGFVVDFLWRHHHLVVEMDGWGTHGTRSAFEADRARDIRLRMQGFHVLRFTWRQLTDDPKAVAAVIGSLLDC